MNALRHCREQGGSIRAAGAGGYVFDQEVPIEWFGAIRRGFEHGGKFYGWWRLEVKVTPRKTPIKADDCFVCAEEQHFLVQLNGQFEGNATGETFNAAGKTDILLRFDDRNVFIAECKFWRGPKEFSEAIDQLLSYTSWRDTKTAILVFNRGTATTMVLEGIRSSSEAHQNFKRTLPWSHESGFRFVYHHPGDTNRELILTVLVFDVPRVST